jgi:LAO/AO transport system kinase
MMMLFSTEQLVEGVLTGNRRMLSRLITQVENDTSLANEALKVLFPYTGKAYTVGVTGAPGTGKSVLVSALTEYLRQQDKTVAIIAVDPTSPFSGGAVLGDRVRMRNLSGDKGVFIRSMATRGNLGGLARTTFGVMRVLDAAGFDYVLVETVGAGQNEVDVANTASTTIVVEAPGLGDDVQAIKAGILETADVLVVNKADKPGVKNTVRALRAMLELGHRQRTIAHHGQIMIQKDDAGEVQYDFWQVPIVETIATKGNGIPELAQAIDDHRHYLEETGIRVERERIRLQTELINRLQDTLLSRLMATMSAEQIDAIVQQLVNRSIDPIGAVQAILKD